MERRLIPATGYIHGGHEPFCSDLGEVHIHLNYQNDQRYTLPGDLLYYMVDCGYTPPRGLLVSLAKGQIKSARRASTKEVNRAELGYLSQEKVDEAARLGWLHGYRFSDMLPALVEQVYRPAFAQPGELEEDFEKRLFKGRTLSQLLPLLPECQRDSAQAASDSQDGKAASEPPHRGRRYNLDAVVDAMREGWAVAPPRDKSGGSNGGRSGSR